jgi:hypothetical protein
VGKKTPPHFVSSARRFFVGGRVFVASAMGRAWAFSR